jgi:hypothetical protein
LVVGCACDKQIRLSYEPCLDEDGSKRSAEEIRTVHINSPYSPIVTLVGAESFTIVSIPDVDHQVLRTGEEEIAFSIVLDLCERTLVSLKQNWALVHHEI